MAPTVAQIQADDAAKRELLHAITPGPAAQRVQAPPPEPRRTEEPARRKHDVELTEPIEPVVLGDDTSTSMFISGGSSPQQLPAPVPQPPRVRAPSTVPPPVPQTSSTMTLGSAPNLRPPAPTPEALPLPAPPVVPMVVASTKPVPTGATPPPTRIQKPDQHDDRPFQPPKVQPVPEIPEPGLIQAAKYAARFARARYQRRGAIKALGVEIKQDTEALDQVLGALGREARTVGVEGRVFSAENASIETAEQRVQQLHKEHTEVDGRKGDENSKFLDIERERNAKVNEAERAVDEANRELSTVEAQRRGLRDKRKDVERRQKAYLKAAEDHDRQAGSAQMGDQRTELRRTAESHRKEAAALEPDRQELDRRIAALEKPIGELTAKLDAAKAELDAAKRSLSDAREGHNHRLAELDAEHKRKSREIALAEGEISRRLVTLGTLVNLNRIEDARFTELYTRIDRLRSAITARTTEIERLTAERDAFDRGTLVRGVVVIGALVVALIALVVIMRAIL